MSSHGGTPRPPGRLPLVDPAVHHGGPCRHHGGRPRAASLSSCVHARRSVPASGRQPGEVIAAYSAGVRRGPPRRCVRPAPGRRRGRTVDAQPDLRGERCHGVPEELTSRSSTTRLNWPNSSKPTRPNSWAQAATSARDHLRREVGGEVGGQPLGLGAQFGAGARAARPAARPRVGVAHDADERARPTREAAGDGGLSGAV